VPEELVGAVDQVNVQGRLSENGELRMKNEEAGNDGIDLAFHPSSFMIPSSAFFILHSSFSIL
jgi:hypothetical protein